MSNINNWFIYAYQLNQKAHVFQLIVIIMFSLYKVLILSLDDCMSLKENGSSYSD